jgi:hemerythrin-like domain-containing protein
MNHDRSARTPTGTAAARYGRPCAPDLTGIRLAHRAVLADAARLAALLTALAPAAETITRARAAAIAAYVHRYNSAVRDHHRAEDEILWPVVLDAVADAADVAADLMGYVDEHEALGALQDACDDAARRFAAGPACLVRPLADLLEAQRDLLVRHITAEEEHLFPVITRHVPGPAYAAAEARIRQADRSGDPAWTRAWLLRHATEEELARLFPGGAPDPAALAPLLRAREAQEAEVFAGRCPGGS